MAVTKEQLQLLLDTSNFQPGWRRGMPDEQYHRDKTAVNFSSLKMIEKSEWSFAKSYWGKPKEPTAPMKLGSLAHIAMLEGTKFRERYVVMPEFVGFTAKGEPTTSKNSKDVQFQTQAWLADQPPGAIIVTVDERDKLFAMIDSVLSNEKAVTLLQNGEAEIKGYWIDQVTGLPCRMMDDFLSFNLGILADLKTCADARWDMFRKSVENYNYPLQMSMYAEGVKVITGKEPEAKAWIAVESDGAHECRIHEVSPYYDDIGKFEFRRCMDKLKKAIDNNHWPQGGDEIFVGEPSYWWLKKYIALGVVDAE